MKVTFRQVGGFAPTALGYAVDAAQLPPAEGAQLRALIEGCGFWTLADARMAHAADVPTMWITVEDGARRHTVVLSLMRVPEIALPLVQFLHARSHNLLDEARTGGAR